MAAPVGTPLKFEENKCLFCSTTVKRLFKLSNNKCRAVNACIKVEKLLHCEVSLKEHVEKAHLCERCLEYISQHEIKIETLSENVRALLENSKTKRAKRGNTSPRMKVAEKLELSVEKLKNLTLTDDFALKLNEAVILPTDSASDAKKSRKKISFGDEHGYSKSSATVESSETVNEVKLEAEKAINDTCNSDTFLEIDKQLKYISTKDSVLCPKGSYSISDVSLFNKAVIEFRKVCPFLFKVLLVAFCKIENPMSKIATLATVYGMILHSRNNRISAIQRLYSTVALAYSADNRLLTKLNAVHLTLTEHSKRSLIQSYGKEAEESLLQSVSSGNNGKFNGDNLDIRVHTNDIRLSSKDRDYHFFASDFTMDRVNLEGLKKTPPDMDNMKLTIEDFIPKENEYKHFKETLKFLLARELLQFQGFSWMKGVVPEHIPHDHEDDMAKKSEVYVLPVSLNNEAAYQDCVHIMDEYEQYINRWYSKTGRGGELKKLRVPVGGDQLTRVRLQGAKALRAGAHTQSERFDHLHPIIIEMFHTLQDFLEKLCKKFLDFNQSREPGTLSNLKILIQRENVNGNVKSRFKAHEDFITTCGISYVHSYILSKFEMETMDDFPKHPAIRETIKTWTNEPKRRVFHQVMDEVIDDLFIPFDVKEPDQKISVSVGQHKFVVAAEQSDVLKVPLIINSTRYIVSATKEDIQKGITVHIGVDVHLKAMQETNTKLKTYAINFLQWYFTVIQMKDAIKEGDMIRTNIILKHMVPFFYSHSTLSKYLVECIDYVLKTEHTLSPYMALKVRAATFVNLKGKPGKNKAADLQKENEVKYLKSLIRSLGANKTEHSIVNITKAGPVMLEIAGNFDEMTGSKKVKTTHKKRSRENDVKVLIEKLNKLNVWGSCQAKDLTFTVTKTPFEFDRHTFKTTVMSKVHQLLMDVPVVDEQEDSD